jgi:hypothetical protein
LRKTPADIVKNIKGPPMPWNGKVSLIKYAISQRGIAKTALIFGCSAVGRASNDVLIKLRLTSARGGLPYSRPASCSGKIQRSLPLGEFPSAGFF